VTMLPLLTKVLDELTPKAADTVAVKTADIIYDAIMAKKD